MPKGKRKEITLIILYAFLLLLLFAGCKAAGGDRYASEDVSLHSADSDISEAVSHGADSSETESVQSEQSETIDPSEESYISDESSQPDESSLPIEEVYMKGIWVSQFDMQPVYLEDGVQRAKSSYTALVSVIVQNIKNEGFNTVFLQMRPYGDSFYQSAYYPLSSFVAGSYGGSIAYDPIEVFIEQANAVGLSVHGWINPLRLMLKTEIAQVRDEFLVKQWYNAGSNRIAEVNGRLYLNPAYPNVRKLICDGAVEILNRYNVDGIHIDDYFYPTTAASFDAASFAASGFTSLTAYRENNINLLVSELYAAVHSSGEKAVFGVSPSGNLATVRANHYADVSKWCGSDGYLDYILPQIYFGFLHGSCPFDKTVDAWSAIVTNPKIKYYVGLSGGNAHGAYNGAISVWAGTEQGKYEWINNKDVLKRSFEYIFTDSSVDGFVFFCYQYLFDALSGQPTAALREEMENVGDLLKTTI